LMRREAGGGRSRLRVSIEHLCRGIAARGPA
jgi:hypothetical protein